MLNPAVGQGRPLSTKSSKNWLLSSKRARSRIFNACSSSMLLNPCRDRG